MTLEILAGHRVIGINLYVTVGIVQKTISLFYVFLLYLNSQISHKRAE